MLQRRVITCVVVAFPCPSKMLTDHLVDSAAVCFGRRSAAHHIKFDSRKAHGAPARGCFRHFDAQRTPNQNRGSTRECQRVYTLKTDCHCVSARLSREIKIPQSIAYLIARLLDTD